LENQKKFNWFNYCLINSFKKNKKIKLTIVGKGNEKQKLINLSNNLNINEKIIFKGYARPDVYC
jgi:glycosyltransferase involved in cell wall biosynthesis